MPTTRDMTPDEYRKFASTGSREPDRRRSQDFYQTKSKQTVEGVTGHAKRIVIIPKNGNPRIVRCKKTYVPPTF